MLKFAGVDEHSGQAGMSSFGPVLSKSLAVRLEAIATRVEAITLRLEAIAASMNINLETSDCLRWSCLKSKDKLLRLQQAFD